MRGPDEIGYFMLLVSGVASVVFSTFLRKAYSGGQRLFFKDQYKADEVALKIKKTLSRSWESMEWSDVIEIGVERVGRWDETILHLKGASGSQVALRSKNYPDFSIAYEKIENIFGGFAPAWGNQLEDSPPKTYLVLWRKIETPKAPDAIS